MLNTNGGSFEVSSKIYSSSHVGQISQDSNSLSTPTPETSILASRLCPRTQRDDHVRLTLNVGWRPTSTSSLSLVCSSGSSPVASWSPSTPVAITNLRAPSVQSPAQRPTSSYNAGKCSLARGLFGLAWTRTAAWPAQAGNPWSRA